jgi:hypothetical protein
MRVEVQLADEGGQPYRAILRPGTEEDRRRLVRSWGPLLSRGPDEWLDREWLWEEFGIAELAFPDRNPEWLVIADEVELQRGARGDVLGVLVTTVPITATDAALADPAAAAAALLWVEYIANAPSLRRDCPERDRRVLKGVGWRLMLAAIARSEAMGLGGRIGLHAEGTVAYKAYKSWDMRELPEAPHPAGGNFPVFFGDAAWACEYRARRQR